MMCNIHQKITITYIHVLKKTRDGQYRAIALSSITFVVPLSKEAFEIRINCANQF